MTEITKEISKLEKLDVQDKTVTAYITIDVGEKEKYKPSVETSRKQCSPGDMLSSSPWRTY